MTRKIRHLGLFLLLCILGAGVSFACDSESKEAKPAYSRKKHIRLIDLPKDELRQLAIKHYLCDCQNLEGHWCGSHALTHAVLVNKSIGLIESDLTSAQLVKNTLNFLKIVPVKSELTDCQNLINVANNLKLDNIFLYFDEDNNISHLGTGSADNYTRIRDTGEFITKMRNIFFKNIARKKAHHFFVTFDVHVALISVISDGENVRVEIYDNLNEPLVSGNKLHTYVKIISDYYLGKDSQLKMLTSKKIEPKDIVKIFSFNQEYLRREILNYAKTPQELNSLLFKIKQIYKIKKTDTITKNIINIYYSMIILTQKNNEMNLSDKIAYLNKIILSIKNSHESKFLDIKNNDAARALFNKAQEIRSRYFKQIPPKENPLGNLNNKYFYIKYLDNKFLNFNNKTNRFFLGGKNNATKVKIIRTEKNKFLLELPNHEYISAFQDKTVGPWAGPEDWQSFTLLPTKTGRFVFESSHKTYLSIDTKSKMLCLGVNKDKRSFELLEAVTEAG